MLKRVIAWVLFAGFVGLLINIIFIGAYLIQSLFIYTIIALAFLFGSNFMKKQYTLENEEKVMDEYEK